MGSYFESSSSLSNSDIYYQMFGDPTDENIPIDLSETTPLPTLSSQSVHPILLDNATNPGRNNVYSYPELSNMLSARTITQSIILTISPGTDIIQSVVKIACERSVHLSVVFSEGFVSEFDLVYPGSQFASTKVLGYCRILSFSGICDGCGATSFDNAAKTFTVSVVSAQGEITGGSVSSMKAASLVKLVVAIGGAP